MPRAKPGTALPTRQASICYEIRSRRAAVYIQYVTEPGNFFGQIHPFLSARLRRIINHSLVAGGTQRQGIQTCRSNRETGTQLVLDSSCVPVSALEDMSEVLSYVKNQNLGFTIPYSINNLEWQYFRDFIVRIDDGHGEEDPLNLILEVTGERKKEKEAKTATARTLWMPAVNNHGGFGR